MAFSTWDNPDDPLYARPRLFVNRQSEASALSAAILQHRSRVDADLIDPYHLRNVLTYYGEGGVGKSELSSRLSDWLRTGANSLAAEHWGDPPNTAVDAIIRWDVNDSHGNLGIVDSLVSLRVQLGSIKESWPAFDLAFSEFYRIMRPGVDLSLHTPNQSGTTLSEVVDSLASDAMGLSGFIFAGTVGTASLSLARRVISGALNASKARRIISSYPQVENIVRQCEELPGTSETVASVGAQIAFLLTEEIHRQPPRERPTVVVFIDHVERLQTTGRNHVGEAALNRLVARLPYFLFVVTGRNSLRWHDTDATHLPVRGSKAWPLLSTTQVPVDEPHQHRVGNLSLSDTHRYLTYAFERHDILIEPGLIDGIAQDTDGWPLHLDTIVTLATERSEPGRILQASDLAGPLPQLVERLLSDLPSDERVAFQAACLMPYFDFELISAIGQVSVGAVERLSARSIVRRNVGSTYPYRVHDTLRQLVKDAGSNTPGGWGPLDWRRAAVRALAEAHVRFETAMSVHDDLGSLRSLALGLNVAAAHGVDADWFVPALRNSPSMKLLNLWLPSETPLASTPSIASILEFLRLRSRNSEDVTSELDELSKTQLPIASTAALWRLYDLRGLGRFDQALKQAEHLVDKFPDRTGLYKYQHAVTLRLMRRFEDALELADDLTEDQNRRLREALDRRHGHARGSEGLLGLANRQASRRFQVELLATWLAVRHREQGVDLQTAIQIHNQAELIDHRFAMRETTAVLGQMHLFQPEQFSSKLHELRDLSDGRPEHVCRIAHLIALQALASNDERLARRAHSLAKAVKFRNAAFIPLEFLLDELGYPLTEQTTQWLEDPAAVKDRWIQFMRDIVDRARGLH